MAAEKSVQHSCDTARSERLRAPAQRVSGRPVASESRREPRQCSRARSPTTGVGCPNRTARLRSRTAAPPLTAELGNQPVQSRRRVRDPVVVPNLAPEAALRYRHDDPVLVDIEPDVRDTIPQDLSPMHEARHRPIRPNPRHLHTVRRISRLATAAMTCAQGRGWASDAPAARPRVRVADRIPMLLSRADHRRSRLLAYVRGWQFT
jgi:hypothetical protein